MDRSTLAAWEGEMHENDHKDTKNRSSDGNINDTTASLFLG